MGYIFTGIEKWRDSHGRVILEMWEDGTSDMRKRRKRKGGVNTVDVFYQSAAHTCVTRDSERILNTSST